MIKFSIIIPTMWLSNYLIKMVEIYNKMDIIDEIIIIDNAPDKQIALNSSKLKIITRGENIYVNPAWNLGVSSSSNPYIIIANDDLLFDENDIAKLLTGSMPYLNDNVVIGPSASCFNKDNTSKHEINFMKQQGNFTFGFGTFMIMKKTSYTIIPDDILIFHGDIIQHKTNEVFLFDGINIETPMSTTLRSDKKIHDLARLDYIKAKKYNINDLKKVD